MAKQGKRGRKAIFTDDQKRILERLIRAALKAQMKKVVKGL